MLTSLSLRPIQALHPARDGSFAPHGPIQELLNLVPQLESASKTFPNLPWKRRIVEGYGKERPLFRLPS